jgi:xylulokinase
MELVADGAARQAAWALLGEIPNWKIPNVIKSEAAHSPFVLENHRELKNNSNSIDAIEF